MKIEKSILSEEYIPKYSRVILPLKALLERDFFNEYIKKGKLAHSPSFGGILAPT